MYRHHCPGAFFCHGAVILDVLEPMPCNWQFNRDFAVISPYFCRDLAELNRDFTV